MADITPRCIDCLSTDVTVRVIDDHGLEAYFCAEDWAANQAFYERFMAMINGAADALAPPAG